MKSLFPFLQKALHLGKHSTVGSYRNSLSLGLSLKNKSRDVPNYVKAKGQNANYIQILRLLLKTQHEMCVSVFAALV